MLIEPSQTLEISSFCHPNIVVTDTVSDRKSPEPPSILTSSRHATTKIWQLYFSKPLR